MPSRRRILIAIGAVVLMLVAVGLGTRRHPLVAPGFTNALVRPRLIYDGRDCTLYQEDHPYHGPWRSSVERLDRVLRAEGYVPKPGAEADWSRGAERVFAWTDAHGSMGPDRRMDGLCYNRPASIRERLEVRLGLMETN